MWIFSAECDDYDSVTHFKARLIAYGYSMIEGVSCDQTYMVLGLTLIDCEPEVVAYSGPTWRSRASWHKVSPCHTIAAWPPTRAASLTMGERLRP